MAGSFTRRRKLLLGTTVLVVGAVLLAPVTPWVESKLVETLQAQGFKNVKLSVSRLGLKGVVLDNISIGDDEPLALRNVSVAYSISDLRAKKVSGIIVEGLQLTGYKADNAWKLRGLEVLMEKPSGAKTTSIPVTREALMAIPLTSLAVKDSSLTLNDTKLTVTMPIALEWNLLPEPRVHYEAPQWDFQLGDITLNSGKVLVDAALDEKEPHWGGTWSVDSIAIAGAPMELPPMQAKGTLTAEATQIKLKGSMLDAKREYHATFDLHYDLVDANKSLLNISNLRLPWNGGVVGVDAAKLPLGGKRATRFTLAVERVSIEQLMKSLTGTKATGTGLVSGTIPVMISADGKVTLQEGSLQAVEPGVIAIAPETIPGDNAQVTLVRDILKNLHYTVLTIAVDSTDNDKLVIKMAVEGKNPDVSGGRPVRLNVQLNGDVLNLIQQNVMAVSDPTKLLEQSE